MIPVLVAAAVAYAPQPSKCACLDTPYLPTIAGVEELVNSQANCIFGPDDGAPWCETSKDHKGWVYCYEVSEEQDAKARSGNVNGYGVTRGSRCALTHPSGPCTPRTARHFGRPDVHLMCASGWLRACAARLSNCTAVQLDSYSCIQHVPGRGALSPPTQYSSTRHVCTTLRQRERERSYVVRVLVSGR